MYKYVLTLSAVALFSSACTADAPKIPLGEQVLVQQIKDCMADEGFSTTDYYVNSGHRMPTVEGRKLMVSRQEREIMPSGTFCLVTDVTDWGTSIQ